MSKKPLLPLGVDDFALCCEIDKLSKDPEYRHLFRSNWKTLAEQRALLAIGQQRDKLPHALKLEDSAAMKDLRATRYSYCFWRRAIAFLASSPCVVLAMLPPEALTLIVERLQADQSRDELAALETKRKDLGREIKTMKRKKVA